MFVSLPMYGHTDDEINERMKEIYKPFSEIYDLCDTFITEIPEDVKRPNIYCLGRSIQLLNHADIVIFAKDWRKAYGCRIERMICTMYRIPYIEEPAKL